MCTGEPRSRLAHILLKGAGERVGHQLTELRSPFAWQNFARMQIAPTLKPPRVGSEHAQALCCAAWLTKWNGGPTDAA